MTRRSKLMERARDHVRTLAMTTDLTQREMAERVGVTPNTVGKWMVELGLREPGASRRGPQHPQVFAAVARVRAGESLAGVGRDVGVPASTVYRWCQWHGVRSVFPKGRPLVRTVAASAVEA